MSEYFHHTDETRQAIEKIREFCETPALNGGGMMLVNGQRGVGKTRLVDEALNHRREIAPWSKVRREVGKYWRSRTANAADPGTPSRTFFKALRDTGKLLGQQLKARGGRLVAIAAGHDPCRCRLRITRRPRGVSRILLPVPVDPFFPDGGGAAQSTGADHAAKQVAKFKEQGKAPHKDWQRKYPEPVQLDTTDLPSLPEGWVWASVEQLGDVQLGRQRSPDKLKGIAPTPYIRAANITEAGIDFSDVLEMDFSESERSTFQLHAGDVLLTEASGSAEHVGRPAVWPNVAGLYCFQNTVLRFQPQGIGTDYAFFSFLAMQKLGVFRKLSGGVGINHLSAGKFSSLAFALSPLSEQIEIVKTLESKLAAIEEQKQEIERSIKHSTAQRQNILRAAFTGKLVPQDPNDEPASMLLARIRAERVERADQPKARRTKQDRENAAVANKIIDVLGEAGDWMPAQEAFRRCGVADGALTERVEELYAELRKLDKAGRLAVEVVTDAQGRKLHDKIKLRAG